MKDEKAMMSAIGSIAISLLMIDFYRKARCSNESYKYNYRKEKEYTHTHTHTSPLYPLKSLNIKEENIRESWTKTYYSLHGKYFILKTKRKYVQRITIPENTYRMDVFRDLH